jgi:hypothetical protein
MAHDPATKNPTRVVPMYGAARRLDGSRNDGAEYSDHEHVPDTTGLTAASWRAFALRPFTIGPIGPFATEVDCAAALHEEYSASAKHSLSVRDLTIYRDPSCPPGSYHSQGRLAGAYAKPDQGAAYVNTYKLGAPRWYIYPERKLSWWFNSSILQFGLLHAAGLDASQARQGWVPVGALPPPPVNLPPLVDIGGPYAVVAGELLVINATVVDPEGGLITLVWDVGEGAGPQPGGVAVACLYPQPGVYTVTCVATDAAGGQGSDTAEITVRPTPLQEAEATIAALRAEVAVLSAKNAQLSETIAAAIAVLEER